MISHRFGVTIISVAKLVLFNETDVFLCYTNFAKWIYYKICYKTKTFH